MDATPQVVILCGGLATRLRPLTETIPKSLVDIHGRPFVDVQLDALARMGFQRVVMCVGFLGEMIRDHVGDGSRFGVRVSYCFDGPEPIGTAAALRQAARELDDAFLLLYGDSFLQCDFLEVWERFRHDRYPALMTVFRNRGAWDRSNVLLSGSRVDLYRKRDPLPTMEYIDYGLSVLTRDILQSAVYQSSQDLSQVFELLSAQGELGGMEVTERFYEVGSHAGLEEFRQFAREQQGK
jgi:NDP-sugar pyrophosphorylase family protein